MRSRYRLNGLWLKNKQRGYPFQCMTTTGKLIAPKRVEYDLPGLIFIRVPIDDKRVVWGFTNLDDLHKFQKQYRTRTYGQATAGILPQV